MTSSPPVDLQAVGGELIKGRVGRRVALLSQSPALRVGPEHRYAGSPLEASPAGSTPVRPTILSAYWLTGARLEVRDRHSRLHHPVEIGRAAGESAGEGCGK